MNKTTPPESRSSSSRPKIGVLGPHICSPEERDLGLEVGREIAKTGAILVCGGLGGMMEAASEGAKKNGGLVVGILPGEDAADANAFVDVSIPTGLGALRNALLVRACDAVIAISGGYGTLSEIGFALRLHIPVVGIRTWSVSKDGRIDPGIVVAETPADAVTKAIRLAIEPPVFR